MKANFRCGFRGAAFLGFSVLAILGQAFSGQAIFTHAWAEPVRRVASINLCADQLLLELAPRDMILSLGPFARDDRLSFHASRAKAVPANRGTAESVLIGKPDLVFIGRYDSPQTRKLLEAAGQKLFILPPWDGFAQGSRDIRALAAAIGREAEGEALIARIEAARSAAAHAARPGKTALVLGRGGYVDARASLVHDLLATTGLANLVELGDEARPFTGRFLPLETVLTLNPDLMVIGKGSLSGEDRKAQMFSHPAFRARFETGSSTRAAPKTLVLPETLTACGGPSLIPALEAMAKAARALPEKTLP